MLGISWPYQLSYLALQQLSNAAIASHSCCSKYFLFTATALLQLTADAHARPAHFPYRLHPDTSQTSSVPLANLWALEASCSLRNAPHTAPHKSQTVPG